MSLNLEKQSSNGVGKINLIQKENKFYFSYLIGRYLLLLFIIINLAS